MPHVSTVAIVGRPNVGKSTLFNRLAGQRLAVVDASPGVTRDRLAARVDREGRRFYLLDTGGISFDSEALAKKTSESALSALDEAGRLLFMVDVRTGVTDEDLNVARLLRRQADRVWLLANKVERAEDRLAVHELHSLGLGEPMPISALHGEGIRELWDRLLAEIPPLPDGDEQARGLRLALVGRPNVGKSSLVNALLGTERMIVDDRPGTTRDAVDSTLRWHGHDIILVDTAGLRRKSKVKRRLEIYSNLRSLGAVDRANVVMLVLDAMRPVADQDQKIAEYVRDEGKGLILAVNKWDLVNKDAGTPGEYLRTLREELSFVDYAPVLFLSALTRQRIHKVLEAAWEVYSARGEKLATSALNKFLEEAIARRPPHHHEGGTAKFFYATQTGTAPPSIVLFVNNPRWVAEHYRRYLANRLRERFGFAGSPLRLRFRARDRREHP